MGDATISGAIERRLAAGKDPDTLVSEFGEDAVYP